MSSTQHVQFFTREGCHLCDDARPVVEAACAAAGAILSEVNIDAADELTAAYGLYIPVVVVNGKQVAHYRVDRGELDRALGARQ